MKTYSTKANANRAAKNQGLDLNVISIYEQDGAWVIGQADLFDEAQAEAEFQALQERQKELLAITVEAIVGYNPQLLLPAPIPVFNGYTYCPECGIHLNNGYGSDVNHPEGDIYCLACDHVLQKGKLVKSSVDNPVQLVWNIADRMWGERRKDIIAECVRQGVAYNTARTQYQAFYKVKSKEGK